MMLLRIENNINEEPKAWCRYQGEDCLTVISRQSLEHGLLSLLSEEDKLKVEDFLSSRIQAYL